MLVPVGKGTDVADDDRCRGIEGIKSVSERSSSVGHLYPGNLALHAGVGQFVVVPNDNLETFAPFQSLRTRCPNVLLGIFTEVSHAVGGQP